MPKKAKKEGSGGHRANPDFRRRSQVPAPEIEEVEQRLYELLSPSLMAAQRLERRNPKAPDKLIRMRARLLTLPVMMAVILSLVFRRLPSLAEAQRLLAKEGLLWVEPLKVSQQALNRRLDILPASIVGQLFYEVCQRLKQQPEYPHRWTALKERFSAVLMVDGTTLESLKKKTEQLKDLEGPVLGGKLMVMVEGFGLRPVWQLYTEDAAANDKRFCEQVLSAVPQGGLLVYDLGFFSFGWFDAFTEQTKYFVTRMRHKSAYKVIKTLSEGPFHRDQIIQLGQYRSNPCKHPLRLVQVLWGATWYSYLTNVLEPELLSAQDVCELYRRRWRIEDAFMVTKRLLDLAYLWSASTNAIQLQLYATLIFYAVLMELCQQLAQLLAQPLERISVEMVFRGFYHYSRARLRGDTQDVLSFLADNASLLGLVKRQRKRDIERLELTQVIWGGS